LVPPQIVAIPPGEPIEKNPSLFQGKPWLSL
jgi:hypothetical protein